MLLPAWHWHRVLRVKVGLTLSRSRPVIGREWPCDLDTGLWLAHSIRRRPTSRIYSDHIAKTKPRHQSRTCKLPEYENTGPGIIADTIIAIILTTLNVRCELGLMRPLLMVMLTDTPRRLDRENKTETDRQWRETIQIEISNRDHHYWKYAWEWQPVGEKVSLSRE